MPMLIECIVHGCCRGRGRSIERRACPDCTHPRDSEETCGRRVPMVVDHLIRTDRATGEAN
jgi:hypothetical protein